MSHCNVFEIKKSRPLSKLNASKVINEIAKDSSKVSYSMHARERMIRGFTYNDMLTILRNGIVRDEPRYNNKSKSWLYKMDFLKFDGNRDASCVVAIKKQEKLHVITVMWVDF